MKITSKKWVLISSLLVQLTCSADQPQSAQPQSTEPKQEPVEHPSMWRGFYLSGILGGGWNESHVKFNNANYYNTLGLVVLGSKFHFKTNGFVGGGALGYNFQKDWFVAGLEVGGLYVDFHKKRKSPFFPTVDVYSYRLECLVSAKARIGYSCRGFLPYIAGGWAGGNVKLKLDDTEGDIIARGKKWANGWTIGAGADCRIHHYFSVGLAYDYIQMSYEREKLSCPRCGTGVGHGSPIVTNHIRTQTLTARINMHL